jgi:O-antigen/teichoic acid export membrane protein
MTEPMEEAKETRGIQRLLARNAAVLVGAQVLAAPLSVLISAMMGRHLGAEDFGYIFLAGTFAAFGSLFIQWGQNGTLPAAVARDRSHAGEVLGTGLAFQCAAAVVVYAVLAITAPLLGYDLNFQLVLLIVVITFFFNCLTISCADAVRGLERTDVAALGVVGQQFSIALFVVPTLLLGGRLFATLIAQAAAGFVMLIVVWVAVRGAGVGPLSVSRQRLRGLIAEGTPFLALSLMLALQPSIDAVILSKLAPEDTVGWHAAARKLVGVLGVPAGAIVSALYPTLCRLYVEDRDAYLETARGALSTVAIVVVPVAVGTFAYADLGVQLFSSDSFGPVRDNLRFMAPFLLLVYFTMTVGTVLLAAGVRRAWTITQFFCVLVSAVADPLLIPYFQRTYGNGGLGVCVATIISEVVMLGIGVWLAPKGMFSRALLKPLALATLAGGVMGLTAWLLRWLTPWVAAPIGVTVYFAVLWFTGGITAEQITPLKSFIGQKLRRGQRK